MLFRFRMAWFAGLDLPTLNQVRSEWSFYDGLGTLVAALCCLSGVSAAIAVSYVVDKPALDLWWFGLLWICIVVCVERVILQIPSSRDWISSLGSLLWRASLSILLAFLITEPIIMLFHQPEIDAQLNHNTTDAIEKEHHEIDADYKPRFKDAHAELRHTRDRKADLEAKLAADQKRRVDAEERGLAGVAVASAGFESLHERRLDASIERNDRLQPDLHSKLSNLAAAKQEKKVEAAQEIKEGNGFEARVAALSDVQAKWPSTDYAIWALRLAFLILDLTPLVATLAYRRRPGAQPYEERRRVAWEWDSLAAKRASAAVRVEKQRIAEEARGDMQVNQARIAADVERRIFATTGGDPPATGPDAPDSAMGLDEFLDSMGDVGAWEDQKAEVPDILRNRALLGLGLLGAATGIALLLVTAAGAAVSGAWVLLVALALSMALCVYTGGFREAPSWAIPPILGTFIAGLVLPAFVLVINL